jgi:NAD(P)-dependent dehydrogenase (short-subunit alcohol dehydrogenase family)
MNDSFDLQKSQFSDPYLSSPRNHFISYPLTMALDGKVALITGGVKNLGAESARELAGIGARLALHYNSESSKASATSLEAELREKYPDRKVAFYQGDLTSAKTLTSYSSRYSTTLARLISLSIRWAKC